MAKLLEFDTPRLRLRQWRASDREPFARMNADPRVMEFFQKPLDRAGSDALAERIESLMAERGWGLWAVEIRGGEFIGFVGLNVPAPEMPFSPCVEIGWRLACAHWGKGFATEAARGALRIGFDVLDLPEIVAFTSIHHHRSRAVMRKLGMREDPQGFEHPAVPQGHWLRKHCLYRLARDGWRGEAN